MLHVPQRLLVLSVCEVAFGATPGCSGSSSRTCTRGQAHGPANTSDSSLTRVLRDHLANESQRCPQPLWFVGAHRAHRLGGPMVQLPVSIRSATQWSATESAIGRIYKGTGASRSLADLNSGSIPHTSRVVSLR